MENDCRVQEGKNKALGDLSGLRKYRTGSTGKEMRQGTHTGQ